MMKHFYPPTKRLPVRVRTAGFLLFCCGLAAGAEGKESLGPVPAAGKAAHPLVLQDNLMQVKGTVTDGKTALPGVSITVVGNTKGVVTDIEGNYSIEVRPTDKLTFSFIGFESQTVEVGGRKQVSVVLQSKDNALEEVTVVAFGKQKKESVVSSITTIRPADLKQPSSNLTHALAGRMAGITAFQRSGEPGANNADFFIRGVTSFGYSNRPLILIDGVEMTTEDLARMQVDDIGSFSIMKDAAATALYGARGANGVILVTTKEGKEGKGQISVRLESSTSSPTQNIELADPITYMNMYNEAVITRNPLGKEPYSQEKIENTMLGTNPYAYPAVDWHSMLFKDRTQNQRFNVNLNGGGKVARYYVAASYSQDNGLLKVEKANNFNNNIDLKQYELRSNTNINLTPTTQAKVILNTAWTDYNGPISSASELYRMVMRSNPVLYPATYPKPAESKINHIMFGNNADGGFNHNPYAEMVHGYKDYTRSMFAAQFQVEQQLGRLLKGMSMRAMYNSTRRADFDIRRRYAPFYYNVTPGSYDRATGNYSLTPLNPAGGRPYLNYEEGGNNITTNNYLEAALNYNSTFADAHTVSGMLIFTMRNSLSANAGSLQASLPYKNMGTAGRFTYGYNSRYFLEANFGYNGSERFAANKRFGFFPSIGAGYLVSNETFWTGNLKKIVPELKFKATHGLAGNDAIGSSADRFFFLSQVNLDFSGNGYIFGSDLNYQRNGVAVSRYANSDITWEESTISNLGVEVNLFDIFDIEAEVWQRHTTNILQTRTDIPTTMGLQVTPRANVGAAKSRGVDLSANVQKSLNRGWWVNSRVNFTYSASEYTRFEEPDYSATPWKSRIGQPIGQVWGYVAERLFVDEKEVANSPFQGPQAMAGDIKYKDINGDRQINDLDQVPIGFPTTGQINYGAGVSLGSQRIDLSCFFQGTGRESFWISHSATAPFIDVDGNGSSRSSNAVLKAYADSYWSEKNRDLYALWPRLSPTLNTNNNALSTWFMRNSSFLRLKSVELGYTLPETLIKRIGINKGKLRIYGNGTNLVTFSKFKLWDPEMGGNGLGYPLQRVINFGVNASF